MLGLWIGSSQAKAGRSLPERLLYPAVSREAGSTGSHLRPLWDRILAGSGFRTVPFQVRQVHVFPMWLSSGSDVSILSELWKQSVRGGQGSVNRDVAAMLESVNFHGSRAPK